MDKFTTYVTIEGSDLLVKRSATFNKAITLLKDGLYLLKLYFVYDDKSDKQLGYYFAVIVPTLQRLFKEENQEIRDKHYVHELLEATCSQQKREVNGVIITEILHVRDMNTKQMSIYTQECRDLILEMFNTDIPDPDPQWKEKLL